VAGACDPAIDCGGNSSFFILGTSFIPSYILSKILYYTCSYPLKIIHSLLKASLAYGYFGLGHAE